MRCEGSWTAAFYSARSMSNFAAPGTCWCWIAGSRPLGDAPRILFLPVSGPYGMGEYARSLAIAQAAQRQWPRGEMHFALSRHAPYAATVPFAATLLDSSPTFHSAAIG